VPDWESPGFASRGRAAYLEAAKLVGFHERSRNSFEDVRSVPPRRDALLEEEAFIESS